MPPGARGEGVLFYHILTKNALGPHDTRDIRHLQATQPPTSPSTITNKTAALLEHKRHFWNVRPCGEIAKYKRKTNALWCSQGFWGGPLVFVLFFGGGSQGTRSTTVSGTDSLGYAINSGSRVVVRTTRIVADVRSSVHAASPARSGPPRVRPLAPYSHFV